MTATEYHVLMNIMLASTAGNLTMMVLGWWKLRRVRQLETLLSVLCIDAFLDQHLPIWFAWSRAFGFRFHMTLDDADSDKKQTP